MSRLRSNEKLFSLMGRQVQHKTPLLKIASRQPHNDHRRIIANREPKRSLHSNWYKGVQLIPCQTVNLEVPAHSEIVIEGLIQPGARVQDGPYFDYTGKPNTNPNAFLFEATQLMFRSNPIFRGTSIGVSGAEDHQLFALLAELNIVDFHGSRVKQRVQHLLLKQRLFRAFQFVRQNGDVGSSAER